MSALLHTAHTAEAQQVSEFTNRKKRHFQCERFECIAWFILITSACMHGKNYMNTEEIMADICLVFKQHVKYSFLTQIR